MPEHLARQANLLALARVDDVLEVAVGDPLDVVSLDHLRALTGCSRFEVWVAPPSEVHAKMLGRHRHHAPHAHRRGVRHARLSVARASHGRTRSTGAATSSQSVCSSTSCSPARVRSARPRPWQRRFASFTPSRPRSRRAA